MKWSLVIIAIAVLAGVLCLRWEDAAGQSSRSPDGRHEAFATTILRRGVLAHGELRAEIRVVSGDGIEVRRLVSTPVRSQEAAYFAKVSNLITWSADSRTVTIAYDGLEHRIQVDR